MHKTLSLILLATFAVVVFPPAVADAQDKPRIAVLEFTNKADPAWGWWRERGAAAMQDVFITELVKSGKFRVIDRERLDVIMQAKKVSLSGDVDPSTAMQMGKMLGVEYLLVGMLTEYGKTDASAHGRGVGSLPGTRTGRSTFVDRLGRRGSVRGLEH
jgi:curli biogenesis system outer membrane secretion channel CsgG